MSENRVNKNTPPANADKKKKKDIFDDLPEQKYNRGKRPQPMRRGPGGGMGRGPGGMGMPVEKVKNFKGTLIKTVKYMLPFKWVLLLIVALSGLTSLFNVFAPKVQGNAITVLQEGFHNGQVKSEDLLPWILLLGALYLCTALFELVQQWVAANISADLVFKMRYDLEAKLSRLPLKYFDGRTHGEILSRVTNDVDTVSMSLQSSITQILSSMITLLGVLFMMLRISPLLTLLAMLVTPLYILVVYIIAPKSQRFFVGQSRSLGDLNGHVEEMYAGQRIVKLFCHEEDSINEFEEINTRYYEYSRKAQFISGMIMPLMQFLGNLGYVIMCVAGGIFVSRGTFLLGDMQAFLQYVRQFNQPIAQISNITNSIQQVLAAAERIFEVLDEEEEVPESITPKDIKNPQGAVKFEHIEFGYSPDKILMKDLDIDVKPGQTIAVVGPTGAGKTTLVNLLMRFYDVSKGRITVDGVDIRDMTRGGLRKMFGMVLQDTWLFNGTIRENIAYGVDNATDQQIIDASVAARSDHFIRTLQDGYNTKINEDATNISQGQKQLLTIARAFLADPAILILDEATSSVDTRTEILIQHAMEELMQGRTSFVIAHRLSTIRDADKILVMNHGTIVEQGNHEELLAAKGFYYDLYNSQFTDSDVEEEAV